MKNILLITILLFLNINCPSFQKLADDTERNIQDAEKRHKEIVKQIIETNEKVEKQVIETDKIITKAIKSKDAIEITKALNICKIKLKENKIYLANTLEKCKKDLEETLKDFKVTGETVKSMNWWLKFRKAMGNLLWYSIGFNILTIIFIIFSILSKTGRLALKTYLGR